MRSLLRSSGFEAGLHLKETQLKEPSSRWFIPVMISGVGILSVDQCLKSWSATLEPASIPGIAVGVTNEGTLLGWITGSHAFLAILMVAVLASSLLALRPIVLAEEFPGWALGMMVGGALSNIVDRIIHGPVIDYLNLGGFAFNIGDVGVVVGIFFVLRIGRSARRHAQVASYCQDVYGATWEARLGKPMETVR